MMLFADSPWWENPAFGNAVTTLILALAAYLAYIANRTKKDVKENTELTKKGVDKVTDLQSDTKDAKLTASAAAVIAKRSEMKTGEIHEDIKSDLQTIKHELNGGFADKVQQAMAEHVGETKKRFDALESVTTDIRRMLAAICPECPKTQAIRNLLEEKGTQR